ncbi:MAG: ferric reductase-like transmembrane domain-containing protein [Bacilli bacterium]
MIFIQKSWRGLLLIITLIILNFYFWFTATPIVPQPFESILAQAIGSAILVCFFIVFLLSMRIKLLIRWFGGLDRLYFYHRWLAILPLFIILIHEELSEAIIEVFNIETALLGEANGAGETAQKIFIGLIVIALLSKFLKYEHWRFIHRLMIIPFILGCYHAFYSATFDLFDLSPLSIFMLVIAIGGMVASAYMVYTYQWLAFMNRGKVTKIDRLNESTIEIELTLKRKYRYTPGQFAFIKVFQKGIEDAPHPFSLSGKDGKKVYFTIKVLGDYTQSLSQHLKLGTTIALTSAYGTLTMAKGGPKQVWIAGGIGITPFLATLRSQIHLKPSVDFYYSYRNEKEAVHLDFLNNISKQYPNVRIHLHDTKKQGYLSFKAKTLPEDAEVYLCGPRVMVKTIIKQIQTQQPKIKIDYEAFTFMGTLVEDILRIPKTIWQSLKKYVIKN